MVVKKICLITTGGTIAGQIAKDKLETQKIRDATDFSNFLLPSLNYFMEKWRIEVKIDSIELCNIDSSDILHKHWIDLANLIVKNYDDYDAFIVTHGTNTMGYTCAALSFSLANLDKPVIITGSQVPAGMPGTDALTNLNNALRLAVWPYETAVKGIVAVFGSYIISGTRVKKNTEFDYDAFQSFTTASIGRIGRIINISEDNLAKHNGYLQTKFYNRALTSNDLIVENDFDMNIVSLTEFPGMSKDIFINMAEKKKYLFNWKEIPGNDSGKLIDFLMSDYGENWVKTASIAKTDDVKTINIKEGEKIISLNLNNDNTELDLKIDNGKTDKFIVKTENDKINIYKNNIQGFILRAFGAGDVSTHLHETFEYLKEKRIPIVVTTQAPQGNSNFQVNEPGQHLKEKDLAIPAYDMSIESQTTKLAWLLAKKRKGKLDYEGIKREMITDYHGEINVLKEKKQ